MLRLAARMRSRLRMCMPAVRASRSVRMRCMRFATHGKLQGMPPGEARLFYLAAARPPLSLQYSLNWRGRMQVMRDLSASLFERVVHARVMNMVERLYARLAPALRRGQGGDALQRRINDLWRDPVHQPFVPKSPSMHDAAAPGAAFLTEQHARRQTLVLAQPPGWRQVLGNMAWPAARPERERRGSNVRMDSSRTLLRLVLQKLRMFCVSASDRAQRARYAAAGAAAAFGPVLARDRFGAMLSSPHANGQSRFLFGLRGAETALQPLRIFHASHGVDGRAGAVRVRYLRARIASLSSAETALQWLRIFHAAHGVDRRVGSVLVRYLRACTGMTARSAGWPPASLAVRNLAFSRLRLTFSRIPFSATSRDGGLFTVVPERVASTKLDIEPRQMNVLLQFGHVPVKTSSTHIRLLASRLSLVFREGAPWRTRMSRLACQLRAASAADAEQPNIPVSAFPWQPEGPRRDRSLSRTVRATRSISASRQQGLSLVPLHASRYAGQTLVSLPRGPQSGLATAYTRGNPPPAVMAYREPPRPSELPGTKLMQRIEQQITRKIVHDITQATPWRGDMEKAVMTPRLMRELAEQVGSMLTQRNGLERYRRGL